MVGRLWVSNPPARSSGYALQEHAPPPPFPLLVHFCSTEVLLFNPCMFYSPSANHHTARPSKPCPHCISICLSSYLLHTKYTIILVGWKLVNFSNCSIMNLKTKTSICEIRGFASSGSQLLVCSIFLFTNRVNV